MTITISPASRCRFVPIVLLIAACRQRETSVPLGAMDAAAATASVAACSTDALRPVAAAPAAGLWVSDGGAAATRVVAMIGPALADGDRARLTRRVETIEEHAGTDALRLATDTATVRLELLPPYAGTGGTPRNAGGSEPAAVYALSPLVLVASYEPCATSVDEPRLRYLRRDARGAVALDRMLRRESTSGGAP